METSHAYGQGTFRVGRQEESFLAAVQLLLKMYDRFLEPVRLQFGLSKLELTVLGFLQNNPTKNTAGEIASLRSLSKGNVSCAVDSLCDKGFLARKSNPKDRRSVHLEIQEAAVPILKQIESAGKAYKEKIFAGFTEQQKQEYIERCEQMLSNMKAFQEATDEGEKHANQKQ